MAIDYCDYFRFCFVNYWTMWKFAGVGFCLVTWLNTLHRSSYWPKFIFTIQLVWLLKLISEKDKAFITLVVKLLLQMDLSYTLNTSYYTAFYKHPTLPLFLSYERNRLLGDSIKTITKLTQAFPIFEEACSRNVSF